MLRLIKLKFAVIYRKWTRIGHSHASASLPSLLWAWFCITGCLRFLRIIDRPKQLLTMRNSLRRGWLVCECILKCHMDSPHPAQALRCYTSAVQGGPARAGLGHTEQVCGACKGGCPAVFFPSLPCAPALQMRVVWLACGKSVCAETVQFFYPLAMACATSSWAGGKCQTLASGDKLICLRCLS